MPITIRDEEPPKPRPRSKVMPPKKVEYIKRHKDDEIILPKKIVRTLIAQWERTRTRAATLPETSLERQFYNDLQEIKKQLENSP